MAQRILGLDLGASSVKAALLESTYRGYTVVGVASAPVPPARAQGEGEDASPGPDLKTRQAEAAKQLIAEHKWHAELSVVALPGVTASHVVTLPFTDTRRIEQTVQFEVEGQLPFDLADAAWDWMPLGARDPDAAKTDLLVGVVKKEELAGLLAALAGAGVDPRTVIPAGPAYAALFGTEALVGDAPAAPGAPAVADLVVDIGRDRTSVCVVVNGACEWARTFAGGAALLDKALARELQIDEAQAAQLVQSEGAVGEGAPDPRVAGALQRGLLPIVRELRGTLKAWRSRTSAASRPLRRVWLAGELARLPGLAGLLAVEAENAPVEPLRLTGPAGGKIPDPDAPRFALALALALRGHQGSRAPRLNLRRGDLAYTRDFAQVKDKAVRLAAYVALVLLLAAASAWAKVFSLTRQEALLDRAMCDTTQKIVGKCYTDPAIAISILKGRGAPTAAIPKVSAVDVFNELAARTPNDTPLKFDRIEITREKLHLQGSTDSAESVDKVVAGLKGSKCFADARSNGVRKRASDGKYEFSIDAGLTCDSPPRQGRG